MIIGTNYNDYDHCSGNDNSTNTTAAATITSEIITAPTRRQQVTTLIRPLMLLSVVTMELMLH